MNRQQLQAKIIDLVKSKDNKSSLLKTVAAEYDLNIERGNKVTVEQVIRKIIEANNQCLEHRASADLQEENEFLKTLLPNYLTTAEIRDKLLESGLSLEKNSRSIGIAVQYMRTTGLNFVPSDVSKAIAEF